MVATGIKEFIQIENNKLQSIGLMVAIFKEDETFIVHSPSLNLCGYGNTEDEAKESFGIVLEEFFIYTINKKTINEVLAELGWERKLKVKKFSKSFEEKKLNSCNYKGVPYNLLPFGKDTPSAKII